MKNTSEKMMVADVKNEDAIAQSRRKMYERIAQGNRLAEIEKQAKQKYAN